MERYKKITAILLSLILLVGLLPVKVYASVPKAEDNKTITFASNDTSRFQEIFNDKMSFYFGSPRLGADGPTKMKDIFTYPIWYTKTTFLTRINHGGDINSLGIAAVEIKCGTVEHTVQVSSFTKRLEYVPGIGDGVSNGIAYNDNGENLEVRIRNWTPSDNVTITYIFASDSTEYNVTAISKNENMGTVNPVKLGVNSDDFVISVTPDPGYMLDYWEYSTDGGKTYPEENRIENDVENSKATTTVTVTEDRIYRAVFKLAQVVLRGDVIGIKQYHWPKWSDAFNSTKRFTQAWNGHYGKELVREGVDVELNFRIGDASTIENYDSRVELYKNNDLNEEPFWKLHIGRYSGDVNSDGQLRLLVENIPYMESMTVAYIIRDSNGENETTAIKHYQFPEGAGIEKDIAGAARFQALADLKEHYKTNFAEEMLDEENSETDHKMTNPIEDSDGTYTTYDSFSAVRFLLRYAYEDYAHQIRWVASTEEDVEETYNAALARFEEYRELNEKILAGEDNAYKDVEDVVKIGFYHNVDEKNIPSFAYVSKDVVVRDAIQAAMENYNPRNWTIEGGKFITSMSTQAGDGYIKKGGYSSQIVYSRNHAYALGIASEPVADRDVLIFGNTITPNQYPTMGDLPNKDELAWAIGILAEKYDLSQLEENTVFTDAVNLVYNWGVNEDGTLGIPLYPKDLVSAQNAVDNALAKLQAEFPDDKLIRLDLPEAVLNVMKLINAIGDVSPDSKDAIESARTAYDALSEENKGLVPNYEKLVEAEAAYKLITETPTGDTDTALRETLEKLKSNYSANPATGSMGGEWSILAIARGGKADTDIETKYLGQLNAVLVDKGLDGMGIGKYTEYSRTILALSSLGIDAQTYSYAGKSYDFTSKLLEYDNVIKQGINGPVFALLALDSKPYLPGNTTIRDRYVDYILERQHNDGGWALDDTKTYPSDPDITAMVLQALSNYKGIKGVDTAINKGLSALKEMQDKTHGGFYNSDRQYNSEGASQVIVALTTLGIDPTGEEWTVGEGKTPVTAQLTFYNNKDKMFKHSLNGSSDIMATEQAAYALVALQRHNKSSNSLYDMSDAFGELPGEETVNKVGLKNAIEIASALTEKDYTSESWEGLQTALTDAEKVRDNENATQEDVNKARVDLLNAIKGLKLTDEVEEVKVDTTALEVAINTAKGFEKADYKNWTEVADKLSSAEGVRDKSGATQEAVDNATNALLDSMAELKRAPHMELLNVAVDKAKEESLTKDNYTEDTWEAYTNALERAESIDVDAEQDEINSAAQGLIASIGGLKNREEITENKEIESILTSIKTALTKDKYTSESWSKLQDANEILELKNALLGLEITRELDESTLKKVIKEAEKLQPKAYTEDSYDKLVGALNAKLKLEQGSYDTQEEIDKDVEEILKAISQLRRTETEDLEMANKVLLKVLIGKTDSLQKNRYTEESWNKLLEEVGHAREVYGDAEASQETVDSAKDRLLDAIGQLEATSSESTVDKEELSKQIEEASKITNTGKGYTTESWVSFENAFKYAREVFNNENATQTEINNASRDLRIAIAGLTEYKDDGTGGEIPNIPAGKYATISVTDPNARSGQRKTYFPATEMELRKGETAYSLLQRTKLKLRVSTHPIYAGVYVEAIEGFGEFDDGPLSGWMYRVNGKFPDYSSSLYKLEDGDLVEWVYTRDLGKDVGSTWKPSTEPSTEASRTVEPRATVKDEKGSVAIKLEDIKDAIANAKLKDGDIIINPKVSGKLKSMEVSLARKALNEIIKQTDASLVIKTPIGNTTIPNSTLSSIVSEAKGSTITLVIERIEEKILTEEQQKTLGNSDIFNIYILSEGKEITSFGDNTITISLPYTLKSNEKADNVKVWHIDDAKELKQMTSTYDQKKEMATFKTSNLSYYLVGIEEAHSDKVTINFVDVKESDWFYKAVKFVVENNLFKGTSETTFGPNEIMTRSMLVTVLHRMEDLPAPKATNSFTDVKGGQWYTDAILWANDNGIASGYGNGKFGINDPITREQMVVILHNYAIYKGYDVSATDDLSSYTDVSDISPWAKEPINWANANRLITGRSATTLVPKGTATRGEVASILQRFVEGFMK